MLCLAVVIPAAADETNPVLRLTVDLIDGSRIVGIPTLETVRIQATYAKLEVPLKEVRTIQVDPNRAGVSVEMQNGDKLKGMLSLEALWDGRNVSLYLDGMLQGTSQAAGSLNYAHRSSFRIGHTANSGEAHARDEFYYFLGAIDEVMFFSRALTGDEVKTIYNDQK
jgi:hypothetical protein